VARSLATISVASWTENEAQQLDDSGVISLSPYYEYYLLTVLVYPPMNPFSCCVPACSAAATAAAAVGDRGVQKRAAVGHPPPPSLPIYLYISYIYTHVYIHIYI